MYEIILVARRRMAITKFKVGIQHADTKLLNSGSGSVPDTFEIMETEGGIRSLTGATQTIQDSASTGEVCRVGDIIKYVNLFIETGPRNNQGVAQDRNGWLEWAFVCVKESETTVPITTIGTQTLGVICTNMFRNECIYTGCIPHGVDIPNYAEIKIKIPKFKQKIRLGDEWRFITYFRATSSTASGTVETRQVKSFMYKTYS